MPQTKKLQKQIENKLEKLSKLLDKITEAHAINSDDPETWDPDALYNLTANLKEALALLEDKRDEFGQPLILEEGLGTLVDEYHSENEN